jgi:Domain of unknown function (DUF4192)
MSTDPPIRVHLHTTADLIAAVPALLGFHPTNSLVAIYLHRDRLVLAARQDLATLTARPAALVTPTAYVPTDTIHLILITDDNGPNGTPPWTAALDAVRDQMRQVGLHIAHATWVPAVQPGAPWRCYDDPSCRGTLADPGTTPLAAAAADARHPIHPSRDALTRHLRPDDPQALHRRAALIAAHPPLTTAHGLRLINAAVEAAARGQLPEHDEHIAELAVALANPRTRDRSTGYALGDQADAAEQLWTALARTTPPPHRADAAILLALSAYLRGDGPLAILALHAGAKAHPGNTLIRVLQTAIAIGLPPDGVRDLIAATTATDAVPGGDTG